MMDHAFYVEAAWIVTALVAAATAIGVWLDGRRLQRDLKRLEAQGVRRRSAPSGDVA
jgi:heme exporter protein D